MHLFSFLCLLLLLCVSSFGRKLPRVKNVEGKIVGGDPVSLIQYPSAALFYNLGALCGGTILNSWTVMTAAHCFDNNKDIQNMVVEVGARYIYDFNARQYRVDHYVIHNEYNKSTMFACDIALVFVINNITFGNNIKKAIIAYNNIWMRPKEKNFKVIGWGWTKYGGSVSEDGLLMAELEYVPAKTCGRLHNLQLSPDMFCLYGNGSKDTCKGDSGGGVLWNNFVVGITSHGDGCARINKPSVYANVWYFRHWIKKEVQKFSVHYCDRQREKELKNKIKTI